MDKREILSLMGYNEAVVYEDPNYESAIIGVTEEDEPRVVYDFEKMVEWLMKRDKCSREQAEEFIEYNSTPVPPKGPVIMYPIWEVDE